MRNTYLTGAAAALALAGLASAAIEFDQDLTPDVIFGSGNANGQFTVERLSGVEIGLRGKLRFDDNNQPQNIFNSNGDGSYTFQAGNPPTGFGFDPNNPTTPVWNFEWSVNTDYDGSSGLNLDDFTYQMGLDGDPSGGTNFLLFDPITPGVDAAFFDHAVGDNTTANGGGTVAGSEADYISLLANNNVAQNSWNYEFFNDSGPLASFNPNVFGEYEIFLAALDANGNEVSRSSITIKVVPTPGALSLFGLAGLAAVRRRRG